MIVKRKRQQEVVEACSSSVTSNNEDRSSRTSNSNAPSTNTGHDFIRRYFWPIIKRNTLQLVILTTVIDTVCTFILNCVATWCRQRNENAYGTSNTTLINNGIGPALFQCQKSVRVIVLRYAGHLILWHGLKFGIIALFDGCLSTYVKRSLVLFLLLYCVSCMHRHALKEDEIKFLNETIENQKLECEDEIKFLNETIKNQKLVCENKIKLQSKLTENQKVKYENKIKLQNKLSENQKLECENRIKLQNKITENQKLECENKIKLQNEITENQKIECENEKQVLKQTIENQKLEDKEETKSAEGQGEAENQMAGSTEPQEETESTGRLLSYEVYLTPCGGVQAQSLCAVTGSTVKIPCSFATPDHSSVTQREWYRVQSSEGKPQDLSTDPQYSGRVSVSTVTSDCELTVRDVRVSDSGVYKFGFQTKSGVHLTVTDLQVKLDPNTVGQREVNVTCSATCSVSTARFYWYRNGQYTRHTIDASTVLDSTKPHDEGSFSCQVYESDHHRSPAVCVLGKECWDVTYTPEHVCALKGTSTDLSCSYKHPAGLRVVKSVWFVKQQADGEPVDVREDEKYQGRVQYTQSSQNNCSLRITNLRERDAQTYRVKFYTDRDEYDGKPGVSLSVTDLKVTVSDWRYQYMTLSCITNCTLSNNPTYIWYKNGRRVSDCKSASCSVAAVSGAVSYSCAVEGHDSLLSPPVYLPKNTRAVVLSSGDTVEGDSVTLSCSSDANPPVLTYSWFKQRAAADTLLTTGQNYSISSISSQDSGLYYCTAHNQLGQQNSTPTLLDVLYSPKNTRAVVISSGDTVEGDSVTLSCSSDANPPILTYSWFKQRAAADTLLTRGQTYSISNISSQHSGLYYCTAHNQLGQHNSTPTLLDVLYLPKNTRAVVLSSGDTVEGDSVTLSCSSDANPPVLTYSWFKQRAAADTLLTTGQNYSISNISSQHSGLYYCTAHNHLGQHNSTPTELDVLCAEESSAEVWKFYAVWGAAALIPALLLCLLTAVLCIKMLQAAPMSSDYNALTGVATQVNLQVKVDSNTVGQREVKVTCSATCSVSTARFYWYRNDNYIRYTTDASIVLDLTSPHDEGSYSCQVYENDHHRSPAVCVLSKECCGVTDRDKYTREPAVSLTVTDLKVTVSDWRDQYITMNCTNPCTVSNNLTYIWYKNGQRVSDCKSASCSVAAVSGAVSYSCAVEGHDSLLSPPVYSPKNTRAVLLSSGDTVEGDSVTLSCSSDANPPVQNYSWFKQRAAADTPLTTGQNYSISNISSQHSGLYYCTAHNHLGQHNSTPTLLDVS
ncbi:B-cell receptor CD22-like, partial [Clarias magur]